MTFGALNGKASVRETASQQEILRRLKNSAKLKSAPTDTATDVRRKVVNYAKDFNVPSSLFISNSK